MYQPVIGEPDEACALIVVVSGTEAVELDGLVTFTLTLAAAMPARSNGSAAHRNRRKPRVGLNMASRLKACKGIRIPTQPLRNLRMDT